MPGVEQMDRGMPDDIREEYYALERDGLIAIYTGLYHDAVGVFDRQYALLMRSQEIHRRAFHKGGPLHNRAIALLGLGQPAEALYSITLAYIEDTLNTDIDSEDDADRAPAAATLRDSFVIKLRLLRDIKAKSRQIKSENRWREATDPAQVLREALGDVSPQSLLRFCERLDLRLGPSPLGFPQPQSRRVFIGTNYDTHAHVIPEIKRAVVGKGYVPVVVAEVSFPPRQTHDVSLLLLHTCSYAVFDITGPAGQLMEIERSRDYGLKVLLVRSHPAGGRSPHVSKMIRSLRYRIRTYSNVADLRALVNHFLP